MTADTSELLAFIRDLRSASRVLESKAPAVVKRGAQNIKVAAQANLRGQLKSPSLGRLPGSISYDTTETAGLFEAEIGPDQSRSGLGVGTEFGSRNHGPIPFLHPAFDEESPKFVKAVEDAAVEAFGFV